jgi:hypothetical protein
MSKLEVFISGNLTELDIFNIMSDIMMSVGTIKDVVFIFFGVILSIFDDMFIS